MEIDIPSLDDVEFEKQCYWRCQEGVVGGPNHCDRCKGTGRYLTPVGQKLLEFLADRGLIGKVG